MNSFCIYEQSTCKFTLVNLPLTIKVHLKAFKSVRDAWIRLACAQLKSFNFVPRPPTGALPLHACPTEDGSPQTPGLSPLDCPQL